MDVRLITLWITFIFAGIGLVLFFMWFFTGRKDNGLKKLLGLCVIIMGASLITSTLLK